jgi:hypothetical protein
MIFAPQYCFATQSTWCIGKGYCLHRIFNKKTPAQGGREVIEAGFIQARNLSSSDLFICNPQQGAKLKV